MNEATLYWVGVDVAKETFDAAVASPGQCARGAALKTIPVESFARTSEGVEEFVKWLCTHVPQQEPICARVVMEATGAYSIELTALLCQACPVLRPAIANPQQTAAFRNSLGLRNKTDRIDARALAFYGLERRPEPYEPLSPAQAELRSLSRVRDNLVETRTAHANELAQHPSSAIARKTLKTLLMQVNKAISKLEKQMRQILESDPAFQLDYSLLTTIPGVGFITAAVVLSEFGDLRRFGHARQIGAHAGVTAARSESGNQNKPGRMSKKGNPRVREALYMAALSAIVHNPMMREVYMRLRANGKKRMVAVGAVMRKLLVLMRAIVLSGEPFFACGK